MTKKNYLQVAIEEAALEFAGDIVQAINNATLDEIRDIVAEEPKKRRGRPPKEAVEPEAEAAVPELPPKKKARKKRDWPKCAIEGCDANVYMPSGPLKMCYKHFREAGGKESPLAAAARKKKAAAKKK